MNPSFVLNADQGKMSRPSQSSIDAQLDVLRAQVELLCTHERNLQQHIQELQHTKDATVAKRELLQKAEAELQGTRFPINWIPPELLLSIFDFFVGDPITLTHVNRKWRALSVSTPSLWARISTKQNRELLLLSLERSENTLLDVTLHGDNTPLVHLVLARKNIIRSMVIQYSSQLHTSWAIGQLGKIPPPELMRLEIISSSTANDLDSQSRDDSATGLATHTSKLTTMIIINFQPLLISSRFYTKLVHLSLSCLSRNERFSLSVQALLKVLSWTPELEELTLVDTFLKVADQVPLESVVLVKLGSFEWSRASAETLFLLLQHLQLPSVTRLDLSLLGASHIILPRTLPAPTHAKLPSVTSLFLHTPSEEILSSVSRKFVLSGLRVLELTNTKSQADMTLPRMESLFHDPRLPILTHMTLTSFALEHVPVMLGYVPALLFLSLDSCWGIPSVMEALAKGRCPQLGRLEFWGCEELDGPHLVKTCVRRNALGTKARAPQTRPIRQLPTKVKKVLDTPAVKQIEAIHLIECPHVTETHVGALRLMGMDVVYDAGEH